MMQKLFRTTYLLAALLGVCCVTQVQAQFQRGQFGGGGFGGGGFGGGGINRAGAGGAGNRQYYGNGTVGEAMISVDPETRQLIVITDDETGQYVSQVVTNLDQPKPQVLIKVVFLEVTHNNSLDIGIEGGFRRNLGNSTTSAVANVFGLSGLGSTPGQPSNPVGQPVSSFTPTPPGAGLYQIMSTDYQATLRAIAQAGKSEILSRPSILARNNQPATITVGQSVPLITDVRYDTFGNAINSVQYTDVGIILRVTPFIHPDGMVEMIVSPEISSLTDDTVPIAAGVSVPVIAKRAADTVVVTPNRQTVIIGGLMQNNKASSDSKIPFLGDIPILGNLFKRKARNDTKTELIIFLTPTIVEERGQFAGMTTREKDNHQLAPKAFSEEELNRYLDTLPAKDKSDVKSEKKKK